MYRPKATGPVSRGTPPALSTAMVGVRPCGHVTKTLSSDPPPRSEPVEGPCIAVEHTTEPPRPDPGEIARYRAIVRVFP